MSVSPFLGTNPYIWIVSQSISGRKSIYGPSVSPFLEKVLMYGPSVSPLLEKSPYIYIYGLSVSPFLEECPCV